MCDKKCVDFLLRVSKASLYFFALSFRLFHVLLKFFLRLLARNHFAEDVLDFFVSAFDLGVFCNARKAVRDFLVNPLANELLVFGRNLLCRLLLLLLGGGTSLHKLYFLLFLVHIDFLIKREVF